MAKSDELMQRFVDHVKQVVLAICDIGHGVVSFFLGLVLVVKTLIPTSPDCVKTVVPALMYTPMMLVLVGANAVMIQAMALPLRWAGLLVLSWEDAFKAASLFALACLRLFLPEVGSGFFFAVMAARSPSLSARIRSLPVIHGMREKMWHFGQAVVGVASLTVLVVVCAPVVVPILAGALTGGVLLVLPALLVVLLLASLLGGAKYLLSCIRPLLVVWRYDPIIGLLVLVAVATGLLRTKSLGYMLQQGATVYYTCKMLTQELLAQYQQRLEWDAWNGFRRRHVWRIAGFGLPIWAMAEYCPLVAVCVLQIFHGAAAALLADLVSVDESRVIRDE